MSTEDDNARGDPGAPPAGEASAAQQPAKAVDMHRWWLRGGFLVLTASTA